MRQLQFLPVVALLFLMGCNSNDKHYTVSHEQLVQAAIEAIADEAHVKPEEITRTDHGEKCGTVTRLESAYIEYSQIRADIRSGDCTPELEVQGSTDKVFWTRHKDWEQRLHEVVVLKLTAKAHGAESKPTALPTVQPAAPVNAEVK